MTSIASFIPITHKCRLVMNLYHRARSICTSDTLLEEESFLCATLIHNGYPAKLPDVHSRQKLKVDATYKAIKKALYIRLVFKVDHILNGVCHAVISAINPTFPAAELYLLPNPKDHSETM